MTCFKHFLSYLILTKISAYTVSSATLATRAERIKPKIGWSGERAVQKMMEWEQSMEREVRERAESAAQTPLQPNISPTSKRV